jgi:hypothetical protein
MGNISLFAITEIFANFGNWKIKNKQLYDEND